MFLTFCHRLYYILIEREMWRMVLLGHFMWEEEGSETVWVVAFKFHLITLLITESHHVLFVSRSRFLHDDEEQHRVFKADPLTGSNAIIFRATLFSTIEIQGKNINNTFFYILSI